jgi:hypothetical protein
MRKTGLIIGIIILVVGLLGLIGTGIYYFYYFPNLAAAPGTTLTPPGTAFMPMMGGQIDPRLMQNMMTSFAKRRYSSNGEKIYLTSVDEDGNLILPTSAPGAFTHMMSMMRPLACVHCHGINGKGGFIFPDGTESADIRWEHLTSKEEAEEEGHPPYTEETIREAITDGVNPAGEQLSVYMPRWQMSERDLNDLIAYLKKL